VRSNAVSQTESKDLSISICSGSGYV
jgi:hypothetical protein